MSGPKWSKYDMEHKQFSGFSEATNEFLWGIRFNNERPWFQAHKQEYIDHVQTPLRQLAEEVYDVFNAAHPELELIVRVSRIYRDARRLYGRGPYKSNLWFTLRSAGEDWNELPAFWFGLHPDSYGYGLGVNDARPVTMARFRRQIDEDPREMLALAKAFAAQDKFRLDGEEYKRPKGSPEPPLDQWYNRKRLDLYYDTRPDARLYSPELAGEVVEGFERLLPYYTYFKKLCLRAD